MSLIYLTKTQKGPDKNLAQSLENRMIQKMEEPINHKSYLSNLVFFGKAYRQIQLIFYFENEKFSIFDDLFPSFCKRCEYKLRVIFLISAQSCI